MWLETPTARALDLGSWIMAMQYPVSLLDASQVEVGSV